MNDQPQRRLFFALWPDEMLRCELIAARESLGKPSRRAVPAHNLHLTLVFLGDRPAAELPLILAAGDAVSAPSFELVLDRFGWFRGARVAWLGAAVPEGGRALVEALSAALRARSLAFDRRDWVPHITLFRQVRERPAMPDIAPIPWSIQSFSLIESISGRPYQVLRTWPLHSCT
ncbi:MAG: RNA 2',3'-cyclic phosphodiesterase [Wenzhouxiangellaceae bacterium]|nr:RNA 2',3'-cyclic phosphodiesterase [Wenzhouxiangellaceae bacterium]